MKVCALGEYDIRQQQPGYHWDGQALAFEKIGYETLLLDIRRTDWKIIKDKIYEYKPDILWLGLKECLEFLLTLDVSKLKSHGCKIIYWFGDLRALEGQDTVLPAKHPMVDPKDVYGKLDFTFVPSPDHIEMYEKAYGAPAFYMPLACTSEYHYRLDPQWEHDISFAGSMDGTVYHRNRTQLVRELKVVYDVLLDNNDKIHTAEFYAKAKVSLGANVIGEVSEFRPTLCTSNRFWIALACGTCHVCQWFPGIERLVTDGEHVRWWKDNIELYKILYDLLVNEGGDQEIIRISKNAEKLAHEKHTYTHRVRNMMDIINGKTTEFYGFL
jgi:hypothetical protein